MPTRRHFIQQISYWSTAVGLASGGFLEPIQKAYAIDPELGTSYLDAEHVVILMQENRSFDHSFGSLQGVRGFNDPRAIELSNGNPVWAQSDLQGETYLPFHLDIKESKTTWMGCLPHSWTDQVDAANGGKHDRWLDTKRSGEAEYANMPLTLGYHTREDIPFYYALADAFTICDQNFCSVLTGTTPNRLHLWTGTIREKPDAKTPAFVRNEDCDYGHWCRWRTFPELLEQHGVSWKIYQNELTVPNGLLGETDSWLANFGDNPIEWFSQFAVQFHAKHREYLSQTVKQQTQEMEKLRGKLKKYTGEKLEKYKQRLEAIEASLPQLQRDLEAFTQSNFEKLSPVSKQLFEKAFVTNQGDPDYRQLETHTYRDGDQDQSMQVPKGDVLFQFRKDVQERKLPTVSWLVAPERFSDHPCSAWYGQWYLSEVLNILTENPEVWKKTIFILTYDENDGYFDHVPPFQAPHPDKPESGKASEGLDTRLEHQELEIDRKRHPNKSVRGNSLGLGFRVPMIIASPWSRGGCVYSEVCDHTSPIRLLEKVLSHKLGKPIVETNITDWRRTICADLTASFQAASELTSGIKEFTNRERWLESIHRARFKANPTGFHPLSPTQVESVRAKSPDSLMPKQEPGTRTSCPLPYELLAEGKLSDDGREVEITLQAKDDRFGERSSGAPFILYASTKDGLQVRHYAVQAGGVVTDQFSISDFADGCYRLQVYGPNGFYRELKGNQSEPRVAVSLHELPIGDIRLEMRLTNSEAPVSISIRDCSYGKKPEILNLQPGELSSLIVASSQSDCWYDFSIASASNSQFERRYAGRAETGAWGRTDPAMA